MKCRNKNTEVLICHRDLYIYIHIQYYLSICRERDLLLWLSDVFPPALSSWSCPVKIIQWQWRRTVCHLTKTFHHLRNNGTSWKQRAPRSDEHLEGLAGTPLYVQLWDLFHLRGAAASRSVDVLRWRLFPVNVGERGAADRNSVFCFSGQKDNRRGCECLPCLQGRCRFFPRAERWYCQDPPCQNTHKSIIDLCTISTLLQ